MFFHNYLAFPVRASERESADAHPCEQRRFAPLRYLCLACRQPLKQAFQRELVPTPTVFHTSNNPDVSCLVRKLTPGK